MHCLGPVIGEYFASEEHKDGKPPEGKVFPEPPLKIDTTTEVTAPVPLKTYLDTLKASADSTSCIFGTGELSVTAVRGTETQFGPSQTKEGLEAFIWVLEGEGKLKLSVPAEEHILKTQDSFLVTEKSEFCLQGTSEGFMALVITMDPLANK